MGALIKCYNKKCEHNLHHRCQKHKALGVMTCEGFKTICDLCKQDQSETPCQRDLSYDIKSCTDAMENIDNYLWEEHKKIN